MTCVLLKSCCNIRDQLNTIRHSFALLDNSKPRPCGFSREQALLSQALVAIGHECITALNVKLRPFASLCQQDQNKDSTQSVTS